MNALRNRVQLIGNLGNDPEIINLDGGSKLAKFAIATNETYKNAKRRKGNGYPVAQCGSLGARPLKSWKTISTKARSRH